MLHIFYLTISLFVTVFFKLRNGSSSRFFMQFLFIDSTHYLFVLLQYIPKKTHISLSAIIAPAIEFINLLIVILSQTDTKFSD